MPWPGDGTTVGAGRASRGRTWALSRSTLQLLDRRVVRLWGPLDDATVAKACAEMMALDATGDGAVQLYIGSSRRAAALRHVPHRHDRPARRPGARDLPGPGRGCCGGRGRCRCAAGWPRPHAQFHLTEPEVSVSGNASQLAAWAEHHRVELERFVKRLALATGRPAEHLEADLSLGRWLGADEALRYGLVDEIWTPRAGPTCHRHLSPVPARHGRSGLGPSR